MAIGAATMANVTRRAAEEYSMRGGGGGAVLRLPEAVRGTYAMGREGPGGGGVAIVVGCLWVRERRGKGGGLRLWSGRLWMNQVCLRKVGKFQL